MRRIIDGLAFVGPREILLSKHHVIYHILMYLMDTERVLCMTTLTRTTRPFLTKLELRKKNIPLIG